MIASNLTTNVTHNKISDIEYKRALSRTNVTTYRFNKDVKNSLDFDGCTIMLLLC